MNQNKKYLTCKRVLFYFDKDEDAFFWWIKSISCIEKFEGAGDELYLDLIDQPLTDDDIRDLIGLFFRYKIDMKQLAQFLTPENKQWFQGNPRSFWHKKVFGVPKIKKQSHKK